jgi:hypothetical protein
VEIGKGEKDKRCNGSSSVTTQFGGKQWIRGDRCGTEPSRKDYRTHREWK